MTDDEQEPDEQEEPDGHTPASWTRVARERMVLDAAPRARRVAGAFAAAVVKTGQGIGADREDTDECD